MTYRNKGMIKRADGSYSQRGLWDNIRAKAKQNKRTGSKPKRPTAEMLRQERRIKAAEEKAMGGYMDMMRMGGMLDYMYGGKMKYQDGGDPTKRTFRGVLRDIERKTFNVPLNYTMLLNDILGNKSPITEKSLTKNEMDALRDVVRTNLAKGKNRIEYADYGTASNPYHDVSGNMGIGEMAKKMFDPYYNLKTTLGQASINVSGNDTTVVDSYDFNDRKENLTGLRRLASLAKVASERGFSPYGQIRNVATHFGSPAGKGSPVRINISEKKMGGPMEYKKGGIYIKPSKRGTFKAQASKMGMGVQEAASKILSAAEGEYSPAMRKKANFAKNFAKKKGGKIDMYEDGGALMNLLPSALNIGQALFAKKPTKAMPQYVEPAKIQTTSPAFNVGRNQLAAGMRAIPTQAGYAQYMQGLNELAGQEAQFEQGARAANEAARQQAMQQYEQQRMATEQQYQEELAMDRAARFNLISKAITDPIDNYRKNEALRKQGISDVTIAAAQISDPEERQNYIDQYIQDNPELNFFGNKRKKKVNEPEGSFKDIGMMGGLPEPAVAKEMALPPPKTYPTIFPIAGVDVLGRFITPMRPFPSPSLIPYDTPVASTPSNFLSAPTPTARNLTLVRMSQEAKNNLYNQFYDIINPPDPFQSMMPSRSSYGFRNITRKPVNNTSLHHNINF